MDDLEFLGDELDATEQIKIKNPFKKLEESLNVDVGSTKFKKAPKEIKLNTDLAITEAKSILKSDEDTFEDKVFIQDFLKRTIIRVESMLDRMEGELEMGAEPRMYEVYAKMVNSLNESIDKLMHLQKQAEMSNVMKNPPVTDESNNKVVLEKKQTVTISGKDFTNFLEELD